MSPGGTKAAQTEPGTGWSQGKAGEKWRGRRLGRGREPRGAGDVVGGSLSHQRFRARCNGGCSPLGGAEWDFSGTMELLKLNRSMQGPGTGPGSSLCRPGVPLLNSSSTGNLSCEPPRIRGTGTRGGCLLKTLSLHPIALMNNPHDLYTVNCPLLSLVVLPRLTQFPPIHTLCPQALTTPSHLHSTWFRALASYFLCYTCDYCSCPSSAPHSREARSKDLSLPVGLALFL